MYEALINEYAGEFGKGRTVDEIVDWVEDLPPMPEVITRALRLVDDFNTTPEELAAVIMRDPALVSPILRAANSAGMGQQQEVTTLAAAILVVGMGRIKTALTASAVRRWNRNFGPVEQMVWEKSLGAASASWVLCEHLGKRYRDELYLTGLLHNLGQVVLLSHSELGASYPGVLYRMRTLNEDFITAEREVIGFSHPLVGALVARKWDFPLATCRAILRYGDPLQGMEGEEDQRLALLKLATDIGLTLGMGRPEGFTMDYTPEINNLARASGFDPAMREAELAAIMEETKTRFASELNAHG